MAAVRPVRSLRVVVADNDPGALDLTATDLDLEGHDVVARCLDGAGALDACLRLRPDVAVLDHRMPPGPFGLDVARRLAVVAPEVGVVVCTNYQDAELVRDLRAAGAAYVPKGNLRLLRRAVMEAARR